MYHADERIPCLCHILMRIFALQRNCSYSCLFFVISLSFKNLVIICVLFG